MSYIRHGTPLRYFKGRSEAYVFYSVGGFVEDYNDEFEDTLTFADLLLGMLLDETKDKKWVDKISKILAKKLNITDKLRKKPLHTLEAFEKEYDRLMKVKK